MGERGEEGGEGEWLSAPWIICIERGKEIINDVSYTVKSMFKMVEK